MLTDVCGSHCVRCQTSSLVLLARRSLGPSNCGSFGRSCTAAHAAAVVISGVASLLPWGPPQAVSLAVSASTSPGEGEGEEAVGRAATSNALSEGR